MHSTAIFHSLWTCGQDLVSLWTGSSWKGREGTVLYPLTKLSVGWGWRGGGHKESPHPPSFKPITSPSQTVFCRLSLRPIFGLRFIRSKDSFCFVTYFLCECDFFFFFLLTQEDKLRTSPPCTTILGYVSFNTTIINMPLFILLSKSYMVWGLESRGGSIR